MTNARRYIAVSDDDNGKISVTLDGKELRGWSYRTRGEQREKMACAREYVEGWCDGKEVAAPPQQRCPICRGEKQVGYISSDNSKPPERGDCYRCDGTGVVPK